MSGRGDRAPNGPDPRAQAKPERRAAAKREKRERERRARRSRLAARARVSVIALVLVAAAGTLALALVVDGQPSGVAFAGDLRSGGRLEELRLPRLEGDGVIEYAIYADRPLVINFFASWCPSCIGEMPDFERVHRLFGGDVAFLGVSQSDARGASIDLARETGVTYDTAIDERGEFFRAIAGQGMPTTVLIRPGGEIADVWVGPLNADALRGLVADHFGIAA
jgi:thiol-disulfide isomerase/thioredoxin